MNTRKLGYSDLYLTEIGFGAWAIGGGDWAFGWGPQDDDEAIAAMRRAVELGVNWIDTAAIYGLGHSEELVGKALDGNRDEIIIATKCSQVWNEQGSIIHSLKKESVLLECESSLERLKTDYIDLYQIHWPLDEERVEEGWEAIVQLIEEGKVRYGGVSNYNVSQMARTQKVFPIASLQPPYNMFRRSVEGEEFEYCRQNEIGVVAYSPIQCGLLSGSFDMNRVAANDWRRKAREFQEPNLGLNLNCVNDLRPVAAKYGRTVSQLAIAWVLRLDVVTSAIVGARRPSQIEETVGGADWKIDEEDLRLIDDLLEQRIGKIRNEGGYIG